jgi:hypothetical protein
VYAGGGASVEGLWVSEVEGQGLVERGGGDGHLGSSEGLNAGTGLSTSMLGIDERESDDDEEDVWLGHRNKRKSE